MSMTAEEARIQDAALAHARKSKKEIAQRLTNADTFLPEEHPVSVFMAGSPGAGKTEASIELIKEIGTPVIRIDPDELRKECLGYNGENAWLFQGAVSLLVSRIHDTALEQSQSFLLDSTLSRFEIARGNVERSLKRKRTVQILYVYQEPLLAWRFVKAREVEEGRRIPAERFIEQYFAARDVVNRLKEVFGKNVHIDLLLKNNDNSRRAYHAGIDKIDHFVKEEYSREQVEELLKTV